MKKINDKLAAFLKAKQLEPFTETLQELDILTLDLLGDALAVEEIKEEICQTFASPAKNSTPKNDTSQVGNPPGEDSQEAKPQDSTPPTSLRNKILVGRFKALTEKDVKDALKEPAAPTPVEIEPNPNLKKFLEEESISSSLLPVFAKHGVTSKESLRALVEKHDLRKELVKDLSIGVTYDGKKYPKEPAAATLIDGLKSRELDDVVKAKANPELVAFLKEQGIPESHIPVFEKNGVTSLQGLNSVLTDVKRRDDLVDDLTNGITIGRKHYEKLPGVAEQVKNMPPSDVRDAYVREKPQAAMTKEFDERQAKLQAAVEKVERLRSAAAAEAKDNAAAALKTASEELEKILKECDADKLLTKLTPANLATFATLDTALKDAGAELAKKLSETRLEAMLEAVPEVATDKLAAAKGLFRGVLLRATEISDVSGSDLLLQRSRFISMHAKQERTSTFSSQESRQYAAKTIDRSSSTFATSNKVSGAGFIGSGIGAVSVAGAHARARMDYRATEKAAASSFATRSMTHRIDVTRGLITIPMDQAKLTPEAVRALQGIAGVEDAATQERYALTFLLNFGSHVFARSTLGGRYDYIATVVATTKEELARIDTALSRASNWQVSSSAGYANLTGMGSVTSANEGSNANAGGTSTGSKDEGRTEDVRTNTEVYGGLDQLSLEYWKHSLEKRALWHVLDRQEPVAIWSLLEFLADRDLGEAPSSDIDPSKRDAPITEANALQVSTAAQIRSLAPILEKVWVQKIFIPSLGEIDENIWKMDSLKTAKSIEGLEDALQTLNAPPSMTLCCFKRDFAPERHFSTEVKLPPGYKILSGGVMAVTQREGNFIVNSYPKHDRTTGVWSWVVDAKEVNKEAKEGHSIRVIGLYDPENEWDVKIFSSAKSSKEASHAITAGEMTGYTITGGGAYLDEFQDSCLTSCGFVTRDTGDSLEVVGGFHVSSKEILATKHTLTALAIGIRATNGARISLRATRHRTARASHIDEKVSVGQDVIGGGVYSKQNVSNYLTGSCPEVQADGMVSGWLGSSKDHDGKKQENELEIVALQPVNVKVTYQPIDFASNLDPKVLPK